MQKKNMKYDFLFNNSLKFTLKYLKVCSFYSTSICNPCYNPTLGNYIHQQTPAQYIKFCFHNIPTVYILI